jgi:hypothetical protein
MARRPLFALLVVLLSSALVGRAAAVPLKTAIEWTRDLYIAEAERISKAHSLADDEFLALFTPEIVELWRAARAAPRPNTPAGPTLNALFGWNVPPGSEVRLLNVALLLGTPQAPVLVVDLMVRATPRRIVLHLVEQPSAWRIAGVFYDEGEDFVSFEKRLAGR